MRRPNPDEGKQLVEEFEASGLTQKQFATRHEVSLSAFQYTLYKKPRSALGRRPESTERPRGRFLPVEVVASPVRRTREGLMLEVALPRGVLLRFPEGTQAEYLAHLVAVLG
ncbi:IS66 family insertion sequence element accessory protein TnpB [Myxococcus sp. CA033]|uniref:IS66 family insertion sequence element accessory protein TnpA n=1 Tax=Myxococcus sp. CA033 TaxID=2741516 RepID=UPI00157AEBC6|nr:IS66 family insertion sequence element accessory protein TnpB [Myxococcus sp. CA033]NTX41584.1 IS66 family insertion sequence element accessory protein TnpB [Myxococcus sp. CA033]